MSRIQPLRTFHVLQRHVFASLYATRHILQVRSVSQDSPPSSDLSSFSRLAIPPDHLYGLTSVLLALQNKRRRPQKLFLQRRDKFGVNKSQMKDQTLLDDISRLAAQKDIPIIMTDKGELNNLTDNRPHQGVVLRTNPLKTTDITSLPEISDKSGNGTAPLWIALDEIQDPQVRLVKVSQQMQPQLLKGFHRTAHFFAVDGIVVCTKNSAPLSGVVSRNSKENGWQIIGAAGRDAKAASEGNNHQSLSSLHTPESIINLNQPRILVLGNEGTGLRRNVQAVCDSFLGIDRLQQDNRPGSVDSLNVGVATGVLISHLKNKIDV
ncbi:hypothetical protein NQZ79_g4067 [Umbelopsis isabellina]|nr:hypothetical protein NQZ79_g4067 [Umbelopsis isabellina]